MIRQVYADFIKKKLADMDIVWIFKRAGQFLLIHLSSAIGKPLCGPILGTIVTNYVCNYNCRMCDISRRDKELREKGLKEFSTGQMKDIIRQFFELGIPGIGFTGGEPLLRKDMFELLEYTKKLGILTHLNTNGYLLTEENILKLMKAGVESINISLDGGTRQTHDSIRGFAGAFDKAANAVRRIVELREQTRSLIRLKIVNVLGADNIDEVPIFIKLAKDLHVDCVEFIPQQPFFDSKNGADVKFNETFFKKLAQAKECIIRESRGGIKMENSPAHLKLFEMSFKGEKSPLKCYAGYNSLAVDCYGEIYPCVPWINWGRSVANIKDAPLKKFWSSPRYNMMRKSIAGCSDCYLNCQAELNILFQPWSIQMHKQSKK